MTDREMDRLAFDYLYAVDHADFATMDRIWELAAANTVLEAMLHGLHASDESDSQSAEIPRTAAALTEALRAHLQSAEIVTPTSGPVTLADVAEEIYRNTPAQLPAEAHLLNDKLRKESLAIPKNLSLPKLIAWLEPLYGAAPRSYWKALYDASLTLDLRRSAEADYQLAARSPRKEPS